MSEPNLNRNEVKVLAALVSVASGDVDVGYLSFKAIGRRSMLRRPVVRLACRSLKRKGLAQFAIGLWTEDGEPRGSGYAATKAGCARADAKLVDKIITRFWD
jgi:hypothetical protein